MAERRSTYRRPPPGRPPVPPRRVTTPLYRGRLLLNAGTAATGVVAAALWLTHRARTLPALAAQTALVQVGVLFVAGACWWAARALRARRAREEQRRRAVLQARQAAERQSRLHHIGVFRGMRPEEFEEALAELCRRDGCTEVRVVGGAGDLGADVIALTPQGRCIVLQAKRYRARSKVRSDAVQIVNGTYREHGGHQAAIVTTSTFTKAARDYAARVGIALLDEGGLARWAEQSGPPPWEFATAVTA